MTRLLPPLDLAPEQLTDGTVLVGKTTPRGVLSLGDALAQWDSYLHSSDRIGSLATIDAYRHATGKLVQHLPGGLDVPLGNVQPADIEALFADLKTRGLSAGGRSAIFRPIKTFFRWCVKRELLASSPAASVEAPKVKVVAIEFVKDDEWAAILATCKPRTRFAFRSRRDLAILTILGTTGARLSEVTGLRLADVDLQAGSLLVHGKGGNDRLLPVLPEADRALRDYLTYERPRSPFSGVSDALWLASKGPYTSAGIAQMVADRGYAAGITRHVHPHELRHRFVAQALAAGMPDALVMALSGHSTPTMLQRYGAFTRSQDAMQMWRELSAKRAANFS